MFFWVKFGNAFVYFDSLFTSYMALSFNLNIINRVYFDSKTKLCLTVPGRQGKYVFTQENFYLQGLLNDIEEQDTSFFYCKHNHIMKSGAPPD